ncbi:biotin-dependent carboxyltransferase family protein [Microbulbifer agarilyticus]|uniref:5-oxoprolinase subunit C family protein n=1 Tax=Microbulbifer agarilyticus TaxID=260552 RepID=UPI001C95D568|nr:biotin-dependent carboxyltransferase family protein [Microbulbifer agarilyticus]MBY6212909.1 biotin-dependent carboxyltransferase family protein [Microbulbifer agarilyticus]
MLNILSGGLQTSIQDGGRRGWMRYGVAPGGAADPVAMAIANQLLGNQPAAACLEVTMVGPKIQFGGELCLAVCGARFDLALNDMPIENDTSIHVRPGDILSFGALRSGARAYLAVSADIQVPKVFGSLATQIQVGLGGFHNRALKTGDSIPLCNVRVPATRQLPVEFRLNYTGRPQLRVIDGAETQYFTSQDRERFTSTTYAVSAQSNRMGIRLEATPFDTSELPQMTSSGLCPGTIQVPPSGQPIVSFVEAQTIGGYPRIGHIIEADQHLLGQLKPRDRVNFTPVTLDIGHRLLREKHALLAQLPARFK